MCLKLTKLQDGSAEGGRMQITSRNVKQWKIIRNIYNNMLYPIGIIYKCYCDSIIILCYSGIKVRRLQRQLSKADVTVTFDCRQPLTRIHFHEM